jgi:UDP-N-acetylglucosamine diphosphorylase/glucosamine-1-phosphate N-acetyltransferase
MTRRLILYEDRHWRALRPLTDLLPVPALAFGASTLAERWLASTRLPLFAIEARARALRTWFGGPVPNPAGATGGDEALVVNAAALPGPWLEAALAGHSPALFVGEGRIAGARLPLESLRPALGRGEDFETSLLGLGLPALGVDATFLAHPWQCFEWNADAIAADLANVRGVVNGELHRLACVERPELVVVAAGAVVGAYAVLDATAGPIVVGPDARVAAHTVVTGPCVIGRGTHLLGGSVSRSTFGPGCRVAGEVEESVWQGYGSKRHHGFLGHTVVGEWVNLGALTTTSDLKNNYGHVRVNVDGAEVDTRSRKVGSLIGAHVKTGIGTLLPTGASVGTAANLFGGGRFAPRHVPSFAWWNGERLVEHELEKMLATARIAYGRRDRTLSPADEDAIRALFGDTASERRGFGG